MKKLLAGLAVAALVLTGCGGPKEGIITSKRVNPPMDWIWFQPIYTSQCSGSGKYVSCTQVLAGVIPIPMHKDECPELTLAKDPQNHPRDVDRVCVPMHTYDTVNLGDYYKEPKK